MNKCPKCIAWAERFADVTTELAAKDGLLRKAGKWLELSLTVNSVSSDYAEGVLNYLTKPEVVKVMEGK